MKNEGTCDIHCINENSVRIVKSQMLQDETFQMISDNFKVLSDPTRVKILYALIQKEICVCDLAAVLNMTDSAVSHQLRLLRNRNMVKFRKEGKMAYYSISNPHIIELVKMGSENAKK
ncbi:ArsR/SmtB family transcription factor [Methanobacterium ferruginis]|jgi:DNA-binding transcriptional ArsR family regulator|uniref:ArsR/SmtB family transcription factor n=1 Tax=Methanobacterium ferruginis TaxID=710191 RepID=UPI002573444E|nr:metalloregulator ArsR/SmtB family transcription factor [Methanobacterium ferruginis]MCC7551910.1 metalloregulator ArsR/SmtB family transcription factor [Methanobacterium sp.]BDZ68938.1 transcription regulator ArsR [Methanobacterium ferruginis]